MTGEDEDEEDEQRMLKENASINVSLDEGNYIWPQFFSRIRETLYLDSTSAAQEQSFGHLQMVSKILENQPDISLTLYRAATVMPHLHQRKPIVYARRSIAFLRGL